jgi:sporulation protein YlmC with PRC-barrel domain
MREQKSKNQRRNTMKLQILTLAGALALTTAPPFGQALAQHAGSAGATTSFVTQQPASEWLTRVFIGQAVHNAAGETVGDIKDLVFNRKGQISTVVIGVGGFLSVGEKSVGIPFDALTFNVGKSGERVIVVALSKDALVQAPEFKATEKTTFDKVKDEASDLSHKAVDKAVDLKDQAAQKIKDMKGEPTKQ